MNFSKRIILFNQGKFLLNYNIIPKNCIELKWFIYNFLGDNKMGLQSIC